MATIGETATGVDPITVEVLRSAFTATCNEMALTVAKTAYSTPVNEGHDFATGLYDRHGNLVAQGEFDLPAFVGLTLLTVPEVMRAIGPENIQPEDIYMINDPYVATTHCNDIHFIKPIFHDSALVGFSSSTAHWSDVGGVAPGSLNTAARSHYEEGMRIPGITLYKRGQLNQDVVSLLLVNMRQSWERLGDLNAQVAAIKVGDQRIQGLIEKHGQAAVLATMSEVQDHSERLARASFRSLPDGVYQAEDKVDQDQYTGEPKTIRLKLTIEDDHAIFDYTESDGPAESGINGTIAGTTSGVFIALASILPPMPMNAGVMRAIEIKARQGSIVWAKPPVAVSVMTITVMDCVIGSATLALGHALPERAVGMAGSILNSTYAGDDNRPTFDAPFINYTWAFGGMGGTQTHDGPNCTAPPFGASGSTIPSELQERRYPVLYNRCNLLPDSGGPGTFRGGLALNTIMEFPFEQVSGTGLSTLGNREKFGPPGIFGGAPGQVARLSLNDGTENERHLGTTSTNAPVQRGEMLTFRTNGGGGYGDPLQRDPQRVLEDLKDEYATIAGVREQYGVVVKAIDPQTLQYEIDADATEVQRIALRAARSEA